MRACCKHTHSQQQQQQRGLCKQHCIGKKRRRTESASRAVGGTRRVPKTLSTLQISAGLIRLARVLINAVYACRSRDGGGGPRLAMLTRVNARARGVKNGSWVMRCVHSASMSTAAAMPLMEDVVRGLWNGALQKDISCEIELRWARACPRQRQWWMRRGGCQQQGTGFFAIDNDDDDDNNIPVMRTTPIATPPRTCTKTAQTAPWTWQPRPSP